MNTNSYGSLRRSNDLFKWILMIPCLAFLLYFAIIPTIFIWWVSFTRYEIIQPDMPVKFVGLKNFLNVLTSKDFWGAARVTFWLSIVGPLVQLLVGLVLALLINQIQKGRKFYTTAFLIPMMVAPTAAAFNFKTMYDANYGPINYILSIFGGSKIFWTGSSAWALPSIFILETWQWTPFMMILILAAISSLPQSIYEVAAITSNSPIKTFFYITLPLLKPIMILAFLLRFIDSFKAMDSIWVLTGGGPGGSTENLAFLTFRTGLKSFNVGFAAAMSIVQLIVIMIISTYLVKNMVRKSSDKLIEDVEESKK